MNRREFNASLTAIGASSLLPIPAVAASRPVAIPASTYLWAQLIARAQSKCSPAMLARHLRITPNAAGQVFDALLRDGVLHAPGLTGIATATKPINATGTQMDVFSKVRDLIIQNSNPQEAPPLVKDDLTCQMCDATQKQDDTHARTPEPVQDITPER